MATTTTQRNGKKKTTPVFAKKYFPVQVAVFEFANTDGRLNHSVELTRSFRRDPESDWENTSYLSTQDLLPAAKLLAEAYSVIQMRLQQAFAGRQEHGEGSDANTPDAEIPY